MRDCESLDDFFFTITESRWGIYIIIVAYDYQVAIPYFRSSSSSSISLFSFSILFDLRTPFARGCLLLAYTSLVRRGDRVLRLRRFYKFWRSLRVRRYQSWKIEFQKYISFSTSLMSSSSASLNSSEYLSSFSAVNFA